RSTRHTASTARWGSVLVTAAHHTIFALRLQAGTALVRGVDLRPQAFFLLAQFRRELRAEVRRFEHTPDLDLGAVTEGRAAEPFECFVFRLHLPQPVAGDELLGFDERAVGDDRLSARPADAR